VQNAGVSIAPLLAARTHPLAPSTLFTPGCKAVSSPLPPCGEEMGRVGPSSPALRASKTCSQEQPLQRAGAAIWRDKADFLASGSLKIDLTIPFVIRSGFGVACEKSKTENLFNRIYQLCALLYSSSWLAEHVPLDKPLINSLCAGPLISLTFVT